MKLNHLHLHVSDLERATLFWCTHFGLRAGRGDGRIRFLNDDDGFDLALLEVQDRQPLPAGVHVGFRLATAAAVTALAASLADAGVALTEPLQQDDELLWFRCEDPDGHAIEVYHEVAAPPS